MKKITLYILLLLVICISACKKEEQPTYNRQLILENVGNNIILPALKDLQSQTQQLIQATVSLNTQSTSATLIQAQDAWKKTVLSWEKVVFFNFGPLKMKDVALKIDFNPVRTNIITSILASSEVIDQAYIATVGAAAKGFPTLEYLLFDRSKSNEQLLPLFTTDAQASRRKAYIKAIAEDIQLQVTTILKEWQASGSNYLQTFIENSQGGNDAVNTLANKMIGITEIIANTKLADPLGLKVKDGTPQPESAEAWRSGTSVAHILANLEVLEQVFKGNHDNPSTTDGFDDYLDALKSASNGQSLSASIASQIEQTRQAVKSIQPSLYEAVTSNPAQAKAAYKAAQKLIILIKVDMMNALGGIVTFNDNDGD